MYCVDDDDEEDIYPNLLKECTNQEEYHSVHLQEQTIGLFRFFQVKFSL
jgi:hypothetical protein